MVSSYTEDPLPMFFAAIPCGQLCGFKCGSGVRSSTLKLMLQRHTDSHAEKRRHAITVSPAALKLSTMYIGRMALPKTFDTMFQRIDILQLQKLHLDNTGSVAALLAAMAPVFSAGEPSLSSLRITNTEEASIDELVQNLLILLLSFHGLRHIHLRLKKSSRIDTDGIVNHGETLVDLLVVNGGIHRQESAKSMTAEGLQSIAIACPHLEQLCLNLYEIDPDRPEDDVLGTGPEAQGAGATDFERAMAAVASMPKLQTLRLTNPPNYRKAYHRPGELKRFRRQALRSGEHRYAFQARADGIMRYLGDRGTNIRLLVFAPIYPLQKAASPDKNGHVWPNYFYYRGRG